MPSYIRQPKDYRPEPRPQKNIRSSLVKVVRKEDMLQKLYDDRRKAEEALRRLNVTIRNTKLKLGKTSTGQAIVAQVSPLEEKKKKLFTQGYHYIANITLMRKSFTLRNSTTRLTYEGQNYVHSDTEVHCYAFRYRPQPFYPNLYKGMMDVSSDNVKINKVAHNPSVRALELSRRSKYDLLKVDNIKSVRDFVVNDLSTTILYNTANHAVVDWIQKLNRVEYAKNFELEIKKDDYTKYSCWYDLWFKKWGNYYNATLSKKAGITREELREKWFKTGRDDWGASLDQVVPFLTGKDMGINVYVYDRDYKLIKTYLRTRTAKGFGKFAKKVKGVTGELATALYCLVENNHIYDFATQLVNSKKHTTVKDTIFTSVEKSKEELLKELKGKDNFFLKPKKEMLKVSKTKVLVLHTLDEIWNEISTTSESVDITSSLEMSDILTFLMYDRGITPMVLGTSKVDSIIIPIADEVVKEEEGVEKKKPKEIVVRIDSIFDYPLDEDELEERQNLSTEKYKLLMEYYAVIKAQFDIRLKSNYNPALLACYDEFLNANLKGLLVDGSKIGDVKGVDSVKSYSSILAELPQFPVFSVFDEWETYDGQELEDTALYIIENRLERVRITYPLKLILTSDMNMVCGSTLKELTEKDRKKFDISRVIYPYKTVKNPVQEYIKELYAEDLPDFLKKGLINIRIIGAILGKKTNKRSKLYVSKTRQTLNDCMKRLGFDSLNEKGFIPECLPVTISKQGAEREIMGYCKSGDEVILSNGFFPIQFQIYDKQRLRLYKLYNTLKAVKVTPVAVNTDCLFYNSTPESDAIVLSTGLITNEFGGYKLEVNKSVKPAVKGEEKTKETYYKPQVDKIKEAREKARRALLFKSNFATPERVSIESEEYWNDQVWKGTDKEGRYLAELKAKFTDRTLITARFAGCGKSFALKNCLPIDTTLFVTPYNVLALEIRNEKDKEGRSFQATTLHRLTGKGVTENEKIRRYDVSKITHIVFDEIYSYNVQSLTDIWKFMKQYSGTAPEVRTKNKKIKAVDLDDIDVSESDDEEKYCGQCEREYNRGKNGYCMSCILSNPQLGVADNNDFHNKEETMGEEVETVTEFQKITFYATGDILQLYSVDILEDNTLSRDEKVLKTTKRLKFIEKVINKMFPNNIHLNLMKRFAGGNADAEKLFKLIFDDLKEEETYSDRVKQIIKGFNLKIVEATDVTTVNNISFMNETALTANRIVRKNLNMGILKVGDSIVCKNALKSESGKRLILNNIYEITDLDTTKNTFTIYDKLDEESFSFPLDFLASEKDYFRSPFCRTCHSIQGLTMKIKNKGVDNKVDYDNIVMEDKITVFDLDTIVSMPKSVVTSWLYVVFTRGETMKQYQVARNIENAMKLQSIDEKLVGYKEADKSKGRWLEHTVEHHMEVMTDVNYVTEQWVWEQLAHQQFCCNNAKCNYRQLSLTWKTKKDLTQYTIQRTDSTKGHYQTNCVIECLECNKGEFNGGYKWLC